MLLINSRVRTLDLIIDFALSADAFCADLIDDRDNLEEFGADFRRFCRDLPYSESTL